MQTIKARINHGRLIADCPDCAGAEFAALGMQFYCTSEFPGPQGYQAAAMAGRVYDVEFPPDLSEIWSVLHARPEENQNWEPGETLAQLRAENEAHGLPAGGQE